MDGAMTTAWYVLWCLLIGGGAIVLLLAAPVDDELMPENRYDAKTVSPAVAVSAPVCPPKRGPHAEQGYVDDFVLWERELLSGRRTGCEHDQRARRDLSRWEREDRRRRRRREH
jgi:hypothetical protein